MLSDPGSMSLNYRDMRTQFNITIRSTFLWKRCVQHFHKSRLVPIGAALTDALSAYSRERRHLPMPAGTRSAFFASHTGQTRLPRTA